MAFDIERIDKAVRRVRKFMRKNSKRPSSDAIHDLRTSIRSLETTFATVEPDLKRNVKRLLRDLKAVRQRAGRVRDMDVLTADALTVKEDGEQDCLVQLIEHLGAARNKSSQKLRRLVKATAPNATRDLKRSSKRLEKFLQRAGAKPTNSDAVSATMSKSLLLSSGLDQPARLTRKNLHAYRLKVKKLRDVLQLSEHADGEFIDRLGRVKDAIGDWHDWEELIAVAKRVLDHGKSCKFLRRLREISDSKYEQALPLALDLRTYLHTDSKRTHQHRKRNSNELPLSTPVLAATAAVGTAA
jgi:CHAD domain-containing protein